MSSEFPKPEREDGARESGEQSLPNAVRASNIEVRKQDRAAATKTGWIKGAFWVTVALILGFVMVRLVI